MARAREIPGLEQATPYGEVAAAVIRVRVDEILEHAHRAPDLSDIEGVHDTRVSTRRLRAALEVFRPCFPKRDFKAVLKEVKVIADALGERRDRDVKIAALAEIAKSLGAQERPGIESLTKGLREEQRLANDELGPFIDPGRLRELSDAVEDLARAAEGRE